MYNGATETIQNFTPPTLTISSDRSLGEGWSCFVPRISPVRPIARDIAHPGMKMPRVRPATRLVPRSGWSSLQTIRSRRPNLAREGMEPIRLSPVTSNEFRPLDLHKRDDRRSHCITRPDGPGASRPHDVRPPVRFDG